MQSKAIDPADFRAAQHRNWDSAAVGWKDWSEFNDRADAHISARLVELAEVRPGSRVLDIAAGYGEPALTAARKAGPEGRVVATDISAEMLAFGRERAAAAGLSTIEFVQADASALDFQQASFDAAVSRWGIIFEPDAEAAAGRIRGFLEPGARIAISSWGEPDQVPFLSIPMRTTMQRLNVPPPPAGTPGPLSRPTPAALGGLARSSWVLDGRRGAGRGHLRVRLARALHRLRQGDRRADPGDDRAARRRGPGSRPGTRSRRPRRTRPVAGSHCASPTSCCSPRRPPSSRRWGRGTQESNLALRFWRPPCYRYTSPPAPRQSRTRGSRSPSRPPCPAPPAGDPRPSRRS